MRCQCGSGSCAECRQPFRCVACGVRHPPYIDCDVPRSPAEPPVEAQLPQEASARKGVPLARGLLDYFPAALAAVAEVSRVGNEQHNPGQPMHHTRGLSTDHADCILRHLLDRGALDHSDPAHSVRHSAKVAWRALALLQEELEAAGAPLARGARRS